MVRKEDRGEKLVAGRQKGTHNKGLGSKENTITSKVGDDLS